MGQQAARQFLHRKAARDSTIPARGGGADKTSHWKKRLLHSSRVWSNSAREATLWSVNSSITLMMRCDGRLFACCCSAMIGGNRPRTSAIQKLILWLRKSGKKPLGTLHGLYKESRGEPIRLMFPDKARFGRVNDVSRCWAPKPRRPLCLAMLTLGYTHAHASCQLATHLHARTMDASTQDQPVDVSGVAVRPAPQWEGPVPI